ncbi:MAG: GNAT family N-acetyltransferase [Acidobacteriota bacterium]|nr:GNAT family N-acetyltransferase [Acidobacteriota bacterium]
MVRVRPMNLRLDGEAVLALQQETYCANFPGFQYGIEFEREFSRQIRHAERPDREELFVAEMNGQVVGFLWMGTLLAEFSPEPVQAIVKNVSVAPERRRQGIGRLLIQHGESWAMAQGARRVRLQVTVSNSAAVALYHDLGYSVDRYEMTKPLGSVSESGGLTPNG